jgi:subtilase family serine protease
LAPIAAGAAVGAAVLALASSALASSSRVGVAPVLPTAARVVGPLPLDTKVPVTVALRSRDPGGLAAYASAVSVPGSGLYRHYLTTAQFAQRFGAAPSSLAAVAASLRAHGLSPGAPTANGLSIPVTANAGQLARAFSIELESVALPSRKAFANTAPPLLDANIASFVQGVLGLDSLQLDRPQGVRDSNAFAGASPSVATGGPQPCAAASGHGRTADEIASAYRFPYFYRAGDLGAGQTIALFQLESTTDSDVAQYQACYRTSTSYSYVSVDGGPTGTPQGEAVLDLEDVIGLAPKANVIVYQGPNGGTGIYDTYSKIVSDNRAKVISTSWGSCELNRTSSMVSAQSTLFQEAATQGQSIFAASGDSGAQDCDTGFLLDPTTAWVDDPGSQPFVTGVGGTTLSVLGPPPVETVWNSGPQRSGGGGISRLWAMPSYQSSAPGSLNVINGNSSGAPCSAPAGSYCREVPDVAADADPATGYSIFLGGAWRAVGGTSAAAPTWAALTALVNGSGACGASPIGFANPVLYKAATYAGEFNDVTSGNNDADGTTGGLYPAGPGYDMATGLGTPIGSRLAPALCALASGKPTRILKVSVKGRTIRVKLSGPGLLKIGSHLVGVSQARTVKVTIKLTKGQRRALRRHHVLKVKVKVKFTPDFGTVQKRTVKVRLRS